jgi:FkbM family methyltransferase
MKRNDKPTLLRKIYFVIVMIIRNIRWVFILVFMGSKRPWKVLGKYQMYLSAAKAGLDPKGKSLRKQLILDGIRERNSTKIMMDFIEPDDVVLELGANRGYYVLIESDKLSDKGYIYAVEPGPNNFEILKRNITLNNIKNVEVSNLAISDKKGTAKLYFGQACNLHSLIKSKHDSEDDFVEVQTDTVDNFLKGKKPVTFLRMDIEGFETELVSGMRETLKSKHFTKMFVEIHPHRVTEDKMRNFLQALQDNGFELEHAVYRDTYERYALGQSGVEQMTLSELMNDERVVEDKIGFQLFLKKTNPQLN